MSSVNTFDPENDDRVNPAMEKMRSFLSPLSLYHRHEVKGIDLIPENEGGLLLTNHSLATYDGFLLGLEIYKQTGRLLKGLGDNLLFKYSPIAKFCRELGLVPASPHNAKKLLREGELIGIAPGGMRESLRPKEQKYKIMWSRRRGFAQLSVETGAPIYLAACPMADDIFDVYENKVTASVYKYLKAPLPIFTGLGPTLIPKPIKLVHQIAGPFYPPKVKGPSRRPIIDFQMHVTTEMNKLMDQTLKQSIASQR